MARIFISYFVLPCILMQNYYRQKGLGTRLDEMATVEFESALAYALNAIGRKDVKLKDEQERAVRYLYDGEDVFCGCPRGLGRAFV